VVRDLDNPKASFVYRGHEGKTTVAKFSPNGNYIASGDEFGRLIVWSWDAANHRTKFESRLFAAGIFDLDWSPDNTKLSVVGDGGSGAMVKCVTADTGNNVGEMVGHNRRVTSCVFKPSRPFRIMTAGEDNKVGYYQGPPFKLDKTHDFSSFVMSVRMSADGSKAASVGADRTIQFYDPATGDKTTAINAAHEGTIYECAFSPDGTKLLTGGADKVAKVWDIGSGNCETTFTFGGGMGDQQNSVLWPRADLMLSVSLGGNINVLDTSNPSTPKQIIQGFQSLPTDFKHVNGTVAMGDSDGVVCLFDLASGAVSKVAGQDASSIQGAVHTTQITGVTVVGGNIVSVAMDKTLTLSSVADKKAVETVELPTWPVAVVSSEATAVVAVLHKKSVSFFIGSALVGTADFAFDEAKCITMKKDGTQMAVGTTKNATHVYDITVNGSAVTVAESKKIDARNPVTSLAYSPTGDLLAIGDKGHMIEVHDTASWDCKIKSKWCFHTSFISCMEWSADGAHLLSGGSDDCIFVWDLSKPMKKKQIRFAHGGGVFGVTWLDEDTFLSVGQDGAMVKWKFGKDW
jgi:WD40 repeat protein